MRQDLDVGLDATKPWWQSKTIWGAGLGGVGMVAALAGYRIDAETQQILIDQSYAAVMAVSALVGTVLVVVGRFRANTVITAKKG